MTGVHGVLGCGTGRTHRILSCLYKTIPPDYKCLSFPATLMPFRGHWGADQTYHSDGTENSGSFQTVHLVSLVSWGHIQGVRRLTRRAQDSAPILCPDETLRLVSLPLGGPLLPTSHRL